MVLRLKKLSPVALLIFSEPHMYPPTMHMANILAEKGHPVYLYGIKYYLKDKVLIHPLINLIYLSEHKRGLKNFYYYWITYLRVLRDSFKNKFSWIIAYDAAAAGPAFFVAKCRGIKWVYHQHDFWETPKGRWQKCLAYLEKKLGSRADIVSFPQIQRAKIFKEMTQMKENPLIVFNGPRLNWYNNKIQIDPRIRDIKNKFNTILLYQGGLSRYFCLENLLFSINFCKSSFAIVFLGRDIEKGVKNELRLLAEKESISNRIFFWDEYVPYDELPSISCFCDIGIAKLTHDGMKAPINDKYIAGASNKIAEYMAAGLPIISSDTEDNRIFFQKDNIGLLCNSEDPQSIANAIDTLLLNSQKLSEMGANNRKVFLEKYNYDIQFETLYNKMSTTSV
jgi:glycosyltransferase involved in cell wall biosynthesis